MKIVAAKCPSCGASIEVDKDSDSTKCSYCNSQIIVEDAIQKYKVELSGSVEVSNLPKFDNYIKLGERYFNQENYENALDYYNKALELNPDNSLSIMMTGLSDLMNNYQHQFEEKRMINCIKDVRNYCKDKDELKQYSTKLLKCLLKIQSADIITNYPKCASIRDAMIVGNDGIKDEIESYEFETRNQLDNWFDSTKSVKTNSFSKNQMIQLHNHYNVCLNAYSDIELFVNEDNIDEKKAIYNKQLAVIQEALRMKKYTMPGTYGQPASGYYFIDKNDKKRLNEKKQQINEKIAKLNPENDGQVDNKKTSKTTFNASSIRNNIDFSLFGIIMYIILFFVLLMSLTAGVFPTLLTAFVIFLALPKGLEKVFKGNRNKQKIVVIIMTFVALIVASAQLSTKMEIEEGNKVNNSTNTTNVTVQTETNPTNV